MKNSNMKEKWYKTKWGILALIFLFPIFVGVYLTKLVWEQKWDIKARIAVVALIWSPVFMSGLVRDNYQSSPTPSQSAVAATTPTANSSTETPKVEEKKEVEQTPEQKFEEICKKYGGTTNCSYYKDETGAWSVTQLVQAKEDFMLFSTSKQISRDFVFSIFATKLPIAHASITVTHQGKYYRAGLGADVAKTQSESTWSSNDVGPTIFYDFLKANTNGSAGDGLDSTYVETNLD